jgi:ankyrin repeat protein
MEQQFFEAIENNHVSEAHEVLKRILASPSVNDEGNLVMWKSDLTGQSVLQTACVKGNHQIVADLLLLNPSNVNVNVNVNERDEDGATPLILGASYGHLEIVRILLKDSRVMVNLASESGCTALWWASFNGDLEIVKWMMVLRGNELDLGVKGRWFHKDYTPLEIAKAEQKTDIVDLLERFMKDPLRIREEIRLVELTH